MNRTDEKRVRPTKAVAYCRVSSVGQTKRGDGLHSQEARLREYAEYKGYELVEIFYDDVSGSVTDRPAMHAMLSHLRKYRKEGRIVIIDDISRFARDMRGHLDLRDFLRESGGFLESPKREYTDDPDSVFFEMIEAAYAQHNRQKNIEQVKNRQRGRLLNGYWPFIPCMGLKQVLIPGRGRVLTRAEPVASVIQEAMEGYASGRFQTQAEVKRFFESQPVFPKNRKGLVRNQLVNEILTKPLYAGYVEGPEGWDVSLRKGQHDGLVNFATFERIQARLRGGAKLPARADVNADFPLRGGWCAPRASIR